MLRTLALLLAGSAVGLAGPGPAAQAGPARGPTIDRYVGEVDARGATSLLFRLMDHEDGVVGLKVWLPGASDPAAKPPYAVDRANGLLEVVVRDPVDGSGVSITVPEGRARWEHGDYVLDGFFLVKQAGVYGGVKTDTLVPVDEAEVRLDPDATVHDQAVGPIPLGDAWPRKNVRLRRPG